MAGTSRHKGKDHAATPSGTLKRSVTVREELLDAAQEVLDDRGFSALVNEGLEWAIQHRRLMAHIRAYERSHGIITPEEGASALARAAKRGQARR